MKENGEKILIALLLVLLVFLWVKLFSFRTLVRQGVYIPNEQTSPQEEIVEEAPVEQKTPSLLTTTEENENVLTFTSYELGLQFSYTVKTPVLPQVALPEEQEQKIIFAGQSIELFNKEPDETLEEAIASKFGIGDEYPECTVLGTRGRTALLQFETAELRVDKFVEGEDIRCPKDYFSKEEVRFFFYDSTFPDRFYFLSLGKKVGAFAPNGKDGWFKTIEIISQE